MALKQLSVVQQYFLNVRRVWGCEFSSVVKQKGTEWSPVIKMHLLGPGEEQKLKMDSSILQEYYNGSTGLKAVDFSTYTSYL